MNVQHFDFGEHKVRAFVIDGDPWFVGIDAAKALGYVNPRAALDKLDSEDCAFHAVLSPQGYIPNH